jgi:ParB family transcriptional regulator, chromosome partitioning protein
MKTSVNEITGYKERIVDIPLDHIVTNKLNPRKRFVDTEADTLIESILTKGLLNPIIVYKRANAKYVILDGERRFKAFKQINESTIPAHVLEKEPSDLENLSLMFHIHNVREEWTDFAIAQALVQVIIEMGKKVLELSRKDKLEIAKITSLSEYKINKYLVFYDYPQSVLKKFQDSEMQEEPDENLDPDILAEMHAPIKIIESELPEFLEEYDKEKIIDACINKKAKGVVTKNSEFRALYKSLSAMKQRKVRKKVMYDKLKAFVTKVEVTPQSIYEQTSQAVFLVNSILKKLGSLTEDLQNLNLNQVTEDEKNQIKSGLKRLTELLRTKLK